MNPLNYDFSNSEIALAAHSGTVLLADHDQVTNSEACTKANEFYLPKGFLQEDIDLIEKINSSNHKVIALAVMTAKKKYKEILHTCKAHQGLHIARSDNLLRGKGCPTCGTHGEKGLSDREFAIKRIPQDVKPYLVSLRVIKRSADRSKLRIDLTTKYFSYQGLLLNMGQVTSNLMKKVSRVISRHGEWVTIFTNLSNGKSETHVRCTLSGMSSNSWRTVMRDWAPRADPSVRTRIVERTNKSFEPDPNSLFKLRPSESGPARLVRELIAKNGGQYLPKTEVMFVGLDGNQRQLRCDLVYEQWKCVVEVQSILHEKSIASRGGDPAFALRVDYDERKRRFFEGQKQSTGITFFAIKGDSPKAEVEKQVINMLRQLRVLVPSTEAIEDLIDHATFGALVPAVQQARRTA